MAAWFQPPSLAAEQAASYRSTLLFYDGSPVKDASDWPRRRQEIRKRWDDILGPWPEAIEAPLTQIREETQRDGFTQRKLQIEIAPQQTEEVYLLIPAGAGPHPAVLVTGPDAESSIALAKPPLRDFAYQLTKRGFVTLAIGAPGGNPRSPDLRDIHCQPLSYLAYVAANCANALARMPEVDPKRIGIVGHGYGGKWALFGSCLCDRFACAVWSEAGVVFDERKPGPDYWNQWYLGLETQPSRIPVRREEESRPRTGAYKVLMEQRLDLPEIEALMAPRPFLVSAGSDRRPGSAASSCDTEARWPALLQTMAVNRLLGFEQRVAMTNRNGHEPTAASNEQIYQFFIYFLKGKR